MKKLLGVISVCALGGLYMVGCGDEGESTPTTHTKTITVADGPIAGATVTVGNNIYTTDKNGNVNITYSSGKTITVKGGVDIGDPKNQNDDIPFVGILESSTNYNTVTPLTTLAVNNQKLATALSNYLNEIPSEIKNKTVKKLNYAVASLIYTFAKGANVNIAKKIIEKVAGNLEPENITQQDPVNALKVAVKKSIKELNEVNITDSDAIIDAVNTVLSSLDNDTLVENMHSIAMIKDKLDTATSKIESAIPVPKVEITYFNFVDINTATAYGDFNNITNTLTIANSNLTEHKNLCILLNTKNFRDNVYYPNVTFTLGVTDLGSERKAVLKLAGVDVNITKTNTDGYQINVTLEKGATLTIEGITSTGKEVSYTLTNTDPTQGLEEYIDVFPYSRVADSEETIENMTVICYDLGKLEDRVENDPSAPEALKNINYIGNYTISVSAENENNTFVPYAARIIVSE